VPKLRVSEVRSQESEVRMALEDAMERVVEGFEDLEVFRRAYRISLEVHRRSLEFPAIEQRALGDQVRRASKSICANLAEGFAKQGRSAAEFKRFVAMAIGSADGMRVWARYCLDLDYIDEPTWRHWRDEYQEIARMLQGLSASWQIR
jgi:four helix bundle protein